MYRILYLILWKSREIENICVFSQTRKHLKETNIIIKIPHVKQYLYIN